MAIKEYFDENGNNSGISINNIEVLHLYSRKLCQSIITSSAQIRTDEFRILWQMFYGELEYGILLRVIQGRDTRTVWCGTKTNPVILRTLLQIGWSDETSDSTFILLVYLASQGKPCETQSSIQVVFNVAPATVSEHSTWTLEVICVSTDIYRFIMKINKC